MFKFIFYFVAYLSLWLSGSGVTASNFDDQLVVERLAALRLTIPEIAEGHEETYERFLQGTLIYRPAAGSDIGEVKLPIASLLSPLESTFDLSQCGDAGEYLSISTGYRKGKIATNTNKYEIWIVPKFVVENEIGRTASHYQDIMSTWTALFGLFYTYGGWDKLEWYDYLVASSPEDISTKNLHENWKNTRSKGNMYGNASYRTRQVLSSIFIKF